MRETVWSLFVIPTAFAALHGCDGALVTAHRASSDATISAESGTMHDTGGGTVELSCPPDGPPAQFIEQIPPPATMNGGDRANVSLTFANCSASTWAQVDSDAPTGFKLGAIAPEDTTRWGISRVALPRDIAPGELATFAFEVTAPGTSGAHAFQWAIVDELVEWLDEPSPSHDVTVAGTEDPSTEWHERSEWESPSQPVVSDRIMDVLALRYITIHFNGSTIDLDGDDGVYQDSDYAEVLRGLHEYHLVDDDYAIPYNSAIGPDGDEWELRGFTYRCAANGCTAVNIPGYAIQVTLATPDTEPSEAQIQGIRNAVARIRAHVRAAGNSHDLYLNGHRDVRVECGTGPTGCPGEALYGLLSAGALEP